MIMIRIQAKTSTWDRIWERDVLALYSVDLLYVVLPAFGILMTPLFDLPSHLKMLEEV